MAMAFDGFAGTATPGRRAIVVADRADVRDAAVQAAGHAGVAVTGTIGFAGIAAALSDLGHADLLLVETAGVAPATLDAALPVLRDRAVRDRARMIVAFATEQIDVVTLYLLGGPADLLCEARLDERVAAIALGGSAGGRLNDPEREAERERLRRLNDEVARIAEILAKLAREGDVPGGVEDRTNRFGTAPVDVGTVPDLSPAVVRGAIRARRLRDRYFAPGLFADPAWDMLLDLFAARLEGSDVSVSSLCIAAAVPPTTALRWIATMHDAALFERKDDPADRRRAFIALTQQAVAGMVQYGRAIADVGLGWA